MATLEIPARQFRHKMPGLHTKSSLSQYKDKTVTADVRKVLKKTFSNVSVKVKCKANLNDQSWEGKCLINNKVYGFVVF